MMFFKTFASLLILIVLFVLYYKQPCWPMRNLIQKKIFNFQDYKSGDLLLFFEHGNQFPFPGHLSIVVKLPKYGQLYVYDMPNPLFHAPDLLKPLHKYLQNASRFTKAKIFIQHLNGPEINVLPQIKYMSSSSHFDLSSGVAHTNFCLRECLALPGLPQLLPKLPKKNLYYCSNAVITILIKCNVIKSCLLNSDKVLMPSKFLHPDFNINNHVQKPFFYSELQQLIK